MAEIAHSLGYLAFASQNRCPQADGPEWLYDQHWRLPGKESGLIRIPLVMENEWGFGDSTMLERITEDYLKLVQARADLRVMVFQHKDTASVTDKLIAMAECFEGSQQGDRCLFAGWGGWDTGMYCRPWSA